MTVGTLFTEDFLAEGIKQSAVWKDLADAEVAALRERIGGVFRSVATPASLNEAQTQYLIIDPILHALGWTGAFNVQTNLDAKGRANVPDYTFFPSAEAFTKSSTVTPADAKLKFAVAVGDAKQWSIGLDQSGGGAGAGETPVRTWPVRYRTTFHMTNDSHLFWTRDRLEAAGAYPVDGGRWRRGAEEWVPLFVGRMIHHFNHRAASVAVNEESVHNAAHSEETSPAQLADPDYFPVPQYWIATSEVPSDRWSFAFRDIARATDERTAIGTVVPSSAAGNTLPLIEGLGANAPLFAANFAALVFDFVTRQKAQSTHLNWYIVEQLPVLPIDRYDVRLNATPVGTLVRDHVLRLTYTANDMAPFARDLGFEGPPFVWNEEERRHLRARLDALYFHLYGITGEADIRYILSTFPIVEKKDRAAFGGVYLTAELIIWYFRALAAGDTDSVAPEATLLRQAARSA